jgi:ribosomal-protein-alanine N-acetyltransferase
VVVRSLKIRPLSRDDLDAVLAIEGAVFSSPWSRRAFEREVDGTVPASITWAALDDGALVGYLVSWLVEDELHIGNVAVAPRAQATGVGTALLRRALADAAERRVRFATLEVRVSNVRAIRLYERFGFRPVAMRKRYYADNDEDALVMMKDVDRKAEGR